MARSQGFHVEGLREVVRDLQRLGLDVDDLKEAFAEVAKEGADKAAGFAPKLTGRLSTSIRGNRAKNKAVVTAGRASVPYAGPINYGWSAHNIKAAGFMQKADEAMQPIAIQRLEEEIEKKIREKGLN